MRTSETRQASGSMEVWIPSFLLGFVKTRRREAAIMEIGYDWFVFFVLVVLFSSVKLG